MNHATSSDIGTLAGNEADNTFTTTKTTTGNSISCSANADATAFSYARDAHVSAFANAHKSACSNDGTKKDFVKYWEKDVAVAVAKVSTESFPCLDLPCIQPPYLYPLVVRFVKGALQRFLVIRYIVDIPSVDRSSTQDGENGGIFHASEASCRATILFL
jgi:hypothetical protein